MVIRSALIHPGWGRFAERNILIDRLNFFLFQEINLTNILTQNGLKAGVIEAMKAMVRDRRETAPPFMLPARPRVKRLSGCLKSKKADGI